MHSRKSYPWVTLIALSEAQRARLDSLSAALGISRTEVVRLAVEGMTPETLRAFQSEHYQRRAVEVAQAPLNLSAEVLPVKPRKYKRRKPKRVRAEALAAPGSRSSEVEVGPSSSPKSKR